MAAVSVVVITYNEEQNIERCLESLRWADEVIVVDSFSTDRTVELARRYTQVVLQYPFDGDIPQRERGFAIAKFDWLLYIDADEEVTPELHREIRGVIDAPGAKDGYEIPRRVFIFGRWIRYGGWYPDYTIRLFRRNNYYPEYAEVHGGFAVRGEKGRLCQLLNHYTYSSIEQYIYKMNDYSSLQVSNKLQHHDGPNIPLRKLIFSPLSHFFRKYFSNKGYRDGMIGFVIAVLGAISTLALYTKLWEYHMRRRQGEGNLPPITNLELQHYKQ
jgi:glycosyltransferase involved in cell wall biosynthesis